MRISMDDLEQYPQLRDALRGVIIKVDGKVVEGVIAFDTQEGYVLSNTYSDTDKPHVKRINTDQNGEILVLKTLGQVTLEWDVVSLIRNEIAANTRRAMRKAVSEPIHKNGQLITVQLTPQEILEAATKGMDEAIAEFNANEAAQRIQDLVTSRGAFNHNPTATEITMALDVASKGDISMEELMETAKRMRDKS